MIDIKHHKTCFCTVQVLIFKLSLSCSIGCWVWVLFNVKEYNNQFSHIIFKTMLCLKIKVLAPYYPKVCHEFFVNYEILVTLSRYSNIT
jgi:hypothetical protein